MGNSDGQGTILVGTRKGAFILESDGRRDPLDGRGLRCSARDRAGPVDGLERMRAVYPERQSVAGAERLERGTHDFQWLGYAAHRASPERVVPGQYGVEARSCEDSREEPGPRSAVAQVEIAPRGAEAVQAYALHEEVASVSRQRRDPGAEGA